MTITVSMRGLLEPHQVKGDFGNFINTLNIAAASGKRFVLAELDDDGNVAMNIDNILVIAEVDDAGVA